MENRILNKGTVNFMVVALVTLLFAGCEVTPEAGNVSMATATAHNRTDVATDLQPNPTDSSEFTPWGAGD